MEKETLPKKKTKQLFGACKIQNKQQNCVRDICLQAPSASSTEIDNKIPKNYIR